MDRRLLGLAAAAVAAIGTWTAPEARADRLGGNFRGPDDTYSTREDAPAPEPVRARPDGVLTPVVLKLEHAAPGRWRLEIADSGIGIAGEDVPRLFEPFFTTRRTGSGLGLPLARNIIEGMGGAISITSRAGRGTTVRLDIPERPATEARA